MKKGYVEVGRWKELATLFPNPVAYGRTSLTRYYLGARLQWQFDFPFDTVGGGGIMRGNLEKYESLRMRD